MLVTKLLVANRGEIAVRVMDAAAALGIPSVAVYAADDAESAHVRLADEAVPLEGASPAAYLDAAAIVEAGRRTGCDAVHPGYGFLAENAEFAERCGRAGLVFAGPEPETLRLLGDKTRARRLARALGIPVLDATEGPTDPATARAFMEERGGPVMVKAVAGGGGRGMRPVSDVGELEESFERARSEAENAFGDGSLYVERLLPRARHIEVQIVGDGTGAVVHLGDRDCGLQRRRQKLIEIAPAPDLDPDIAARLRDAALALGRALSYRGLGTVEFLVSGTEIAFLEVNPRVQVEHTVTEEVTGVDLIETGLLLAGRETLAGLGLASPPAVRGIALQARVNTETLAGDGSVRPASGTLTRFEPPTGRNVRVDTHAHPGHVVGPRYDSLLAKVIVTDPGGSAPGVARRASRALAGFVIEGVDANLPLLGALLDRPELGTSAATTDFVEAHLEELVEEAPPSADAVSVACGAVPVLSPQQGVVVEVSASPGDAVAAGTQLVVLEAMKMEHVVVAPVSGIVRDVPVKVGDVVAADAPVAFLEEDETVAAEASGAAEPDLDHVRPDLAGTVERHRIGLDEGRPAAVRRRHDAGRRTARENIGDLCDPGSFSEYGALAIAAQRRRRSLDDLIANTPADGLVAGTATIGGRPCAVMSYDYTVLAGTQGLRNHRKTDRLIELAARRELPLVIFAEGGGGRPGDTDTASVASLDVPTFRMTAALSGRVPMVAIVSGYCFAGNAALAGACDVIIATEEASLGMGGPAMIEGGGLGVVAPGDVGPMAVQVANGVVDLLVRDDGEAVAAARRYLSYFGGPVDEWECADQRSLRHLVPENRLRTYAVRPLIETLADTGSVLELRAGFGTGIITALARIEGIPVGVIANDPRHLSGAIDGDAADKATRFLEVCQAHGLPVVSLCDTPGFMVGPDAERTAAVRRFGAMFVAGARLTVPVCMIVLRKGYGLGAMAMAGGDLRAPLLTVSWPTGEFGGMGLEGAVRLGYRKELEAIDDPEARRARYEELVAQSYERGKALSMAAAFEIDDVIDPAETRTVLVQALSR